MSSASVLPSNFCLLWPNLQQSAETWFFWLTSLPAIYGQYFRLMFLACIYGWMFRADISGWMFLADISWRIRHISSWEFISNTTFASPGKSLPSGYTVSQNITLKCLFFWPSCDPAVSPRRYTEATSSHHHPIFASPFRPYHLGHIRKNHWPAGKLLDRWEATGQLGSYWTAGKLLANRCGLAIQIEIWATANLIGLNFCPHNCRAGLFQVWVVWGTLAKVFQTWDGSRLQYNLRR